jgi:hypothetical protein
MNEVVIPLKIQGIAQMKAELRELKGAIASATDPAQMAALAQQAGVLSDKIKDANDAVNVFATGSKFEQVSNGLGGIKQSLMSLDFEEAAQKSKTFATALGGINPAEIGKAMTGLATTVGTLGKAFLRLGAQLLVNPIFLMVAIVIAVVLAFTIWEDKLGKFGIVLKVAFIGIYLLVEAVKLLIQGFKDLTDWLGLTAFAAEENAAKTLAANEKVSESSKERTARITADLGREIAEAKAAGKDTTKLEEEKSNVQIKEADKRRGSAYKALADQRKLGEDADQETIKKLKKQITEETELIKQGYSDKKVAKLTDIAEAEAAAEKAAEKAKAQADKWRAADKASEADVTAAAKIISDSKKTAQQIELDDLAAGYATKIATAIKYKNDTTALIEAQKIQEAAIIKKYDDEAKAKKAENDAKAAAFRLDEAKSLAERLAKLDDENGLTIDEAADLRRRKERRAQEDYYKELISDAAAAKESQAVLDQIEIERLNVLNDIEIKYADEKKARAKAVSDKEIEEDKKAFDAKMKNIDAGFKLTQTVGEAIAFMADTNITAQLKKVKKGSKEEEALLKKQFEQNKKAQLAAAIINAAQAQVSILAQYPKFDGGFAMVAAMAGAAITSAMAIGKITSASFSGGGSTPDSPDSSLTSTTAVAPTAGPSLFGSANTGSQVNAGGGTGQNITVTAIVSETEITASQNHINNIQQNSVL